MAQRRNFSRIALEEKVNLDIGGICLDGFLLDISLKGALVHFRVPNRFELRKTGKLRVFLSTDVILIFSVEATHLHKSSVGLKFTKLDAETYSHLVRLLESRTEDPEKIEKELQFLASFGRRVFY
jgi:hypothetical protein